MQVSEKSASGQSAAGNGSGVAVAQASDSHDSHYVGKHRPHRMGLLRPRVRVDQLAGREGIATAK